MTEPDAHGRPVGDLWATTPWSERVLDLRTGPRPAPLATALPDPADLPADEWARTWHQVHGDDGWHTLHFTLDQAPRAGERPESAGADLYLVITSPDGRRAAVVYDTGRRHAGMRSFNVRIGIPVYPNITSPWHEYPEGEHLARAARLHHALHHPDHWLTGTPDEVATDREPLPMMPSWAALGITWPDAHRHWISRGVANALLVDRWRTQTGIPDPEIPDWFNAIGRPVPAARFYGLLPPEVAGRWYHAIPWLDPAAVAFLHRYGYDPQETAAAYRHAYGMGPGEAWSGREPTTGPPGSDTEDAAVSLARVIAAHGLNPQDALACLRVGLTVEEITASALDGTLTGAGLRLLASLTGPLPADA